MNPFAAAWWVVRFFGSLYLIVILIGGLFFVGALIAVSFKPPVVPLWTDTRPGPPPPTCGPPDCTRTR